MLIINNQTGRDVSGKFVSEENICLKYGCSACCNPVRIGSLKSIDLNKLPFIEIGGIFVPEEHLETVRLRSFICSSYNLRSGLCSDYSNRPEICRNTKCPAFSASTEVEQAKVIRFVNHEKFIHIEPIMRRDYDCRYH